MAANRKWRSIVLRIILLSVLPLVVLACTPTVQVAPPSEPITINLNVKIEHEIRVKVDKELEEMFSEDDELFKESGP